MNEHATIVDPWTTRINDKTFVLIPCRTDNYAVIVHAESTGETLVVDPTEAGPVARALDTRGWKLTHILNTHKHGDHVGGNAALKEKYGATIHAPAEVSGADKVLRDGDTIKFGQEVIDVIAIPGHTRGHMAYYMCDDKVVFTGDTLFSLGCGRIFEGTAEEMWHSLDILRHLPEDTLVYCGHEYTLNNAEFCLEIEPGNEALQQRAKEVRALRREGLPTIPVTIALEKQTNVFLRPESKEVRDAVNMHGVEAWRVFAALRERKDAFG